MNRYEEILKMRKNGLSMQIIGDRLGVSKQRIGQLLHPDKYKAYQKTYQKTYQKDYQKTDKKTDKYKAYQKHLYHIRLGKYFSNCKNCI